MNPRIRDISIFIPIIVAVGYGLSFVFNTGCDFLPIPLLLCASIAIYAFFAFLIGILLIQLFKGVFWDYKKLDE